MIESMQRGALANAPLAVSAMAYGAVLGVLSGQQGVTWAEMMGMNIFLFAGSAQFVMVEMWSAPLPVAEIVVAVFIINLRYLLIGASLQPVFKGYGFGAKAAMMHLVADENWAVTMAEHRTKGTDPFFLLGGGLLLGVAWSGSTIVGNVLGGFVVDPEKYGLDFAFVAVFAALSLSLWRGRSDLLPWGTAALLAVLANQFLPGKWYIVIGGLGGAICAALCSVLADRNQTRTHDRLERDPVHGTEGVR
ncbi:MAG: AzlC family ABC transporter permease [Thermodesulfobacteriota bacterium]